MSKIDLVRRSIGAGAAGYNVRTCVIPECPRNDWQYAGGAHQSFGAARRKPLCKIEAFNRLGSVKDRLALGVIEAAEKSGELKAGQTVIATSRKTR
jgi:hypothetical protein